MNPRRTFWSKLDKRFFFLHFFLSFSSSAYIYTLYVSCCPVFIIFIVVCLFSFVSIPILHLRKKEEETKTKKTSTLCTLWFSSLLFQSLLLLLFSFSHFVSLSTASMLVMFSRSEYTMLCMCGSFICICTHFVRCGCCCCYCRCFFFSRLEGVSRSCRQKLFHISIYNLVVAVVLVPSLRFALAEKRFGFFVLFSKLLLRPNIDEHIYPNTFN